MRRTSRPALAVLAVTAALALVGCSGEVSVGSDPSVEQSSIEEQVADSLTGVGAEAVEVACEGDLAAEEGATQDCVATLDGADIGARLTVDQVNESDVDYSLLFFVTLEELEATVEETYVGQGVSVDTVTCDGELLGEVGATATCEVTSAVDGDATIETITTAVDGPLIDYDLEVVSQG